MSPPARPAPAVIDELLTLAQAAAVLGVHPRTVRAYIARGDLTGVRLANQLIRVRTSDLQAFLQPMPNPRSPRKGRR